MPRKSTRKPFGGIDGESYTIDGEHRYVLLMDSQGEHIFKEEGLSTKACFDFVLSRPADHIWCAFGLNYDVNMMLRDVGEKRLRELWTTGKTSWFHYDLEWIPGKWLEIRDAKSYTTIVRGGRVSGTYTRKVKINEVFGFFQTSFVKALAKWNIKVQDGDMLQGMKASRSLFDPAMRQQIIDYCRTECELLCQLMEALRDALESVNINCTSWNGAGSIAAAIMRREHVKKELRSTDETEIVDATLRAYFGGRTELLQQGTFESIYQYDIVSAYPHAATFLPTLRGTYTRQVEPETAEPFGIYRVRWKVQSVLPPFPHRVRQSISYPLTGEGWYHSVEVAAAKAIFGDSIEILEGWVFTPDDETKPFAFVTALAEQKIRYKREGHAGEKVLKLGINSLYGKLAQGRGYNGSAPPYQSYFWAGYITAHCRSRMLTLGHQAGCDNVVQIATDGIFLSHDSGWPSSDTFGSIERTELCQAFFVQPGVYQATDSEGQEIRKSRGFFAREIDFDQLREGYITEGPFFTGHYPSTRFVGLGSALMRKDLKDWRTWPTAERKLTLYPSTRTIRDYDTKPYRHLPPTGALNLLSDPYTPKGGYTDDTENYLQGKEQPLRTDL